MKSYFDFKFKYSLIKRFRDFWDIKKGRIFESKHQSVQKCYKANGLFAWIYNVGGSNFVLPIAIIFVIILNFNFFNSLLFNILLSFLLYIILEIILVAFTPLIEIDCLEKKIQEKEDIESFKK